jgi:small subunit ribosomal protein S16
MPVAVRLRFKRFGRTNRPFWRLCAADKRWARDGRVLEELGHLDPLLPDTEKFKMNRERVIHWLKSGAQPSDSVAQLLAHVGLDAKGNEITPKPWNKKKSPPAMAAKRVAAKKKAEAPKAEEKPKDA